MDSHADTVGNRIEALAKRALKLQGAALAAELGVSYETLRKWKAGTAAPNRNRQAAIALRLGVAPEVFMHGAQEAGAGEPLPADEARLLRAYRRILKGDKAELLKKVEDRAREIEEIELRIKREAARPAVASGKPPRTATA